MVRQKHTATDWRAGNESEYVEGDFETYGYGDREMELFKSDPGSAGVPAKAPEITKKTIVAEVVEAHGCISGQKGGQVLPQYP